ncbi:hypothetical protein BH23ACT3_BH23ACT3_13280 [soil metagenome]
MRALVFTGPSALEWSDVPEARIQDDRDVIVRPLAVARCDLDPAIALGLYPMPAPVVMGHEMVGEIIDIGATAGDWSVGARVIVPFQISCGACEMCRHGLTNACTAVPAGSAFGLGPHDGIDFGGALADLVRVPFADHLLFRLPDGLSPERAAGVPDNVSDGYRCVAPHLRDHRRSRRRRRTARIDCGSEDPRRDVHRVVVRLRSRWCGPSSRLAEADRCTDLGGRLDMTGSSRTVRLT